MTHEKKTILGNELHWKHNDAAEYAVKLRETYGEGEFYDEEAWWFDVEGSDYIKVKDESIAHSWPATHKDFVYYTKFYDFKPEKPGTTPSQISSAQAYFANVSGSILFDGLKQKVCARCGNITAGAVSVKMVEDYINGDRWSDPKQEYADRINAGAPVTDGFKGEVDSEKPKKSNKGPLLKRGGAY